MKERATFSQLIIAEVIKHLPGQHSQLKHAGSHEASSVTRSDIDNDVAEGSRLALLMTDAALRKIEDYIATKMDLRQQSRTRYPQVGYAEKCRQYIAELEKDPDFLSGVNAINEFQQAAITAERYYRGVAASRIKDLIKNGTIQPYAFTERNEYYGKVFAPDTSMSLDPLVVKDYGPFTLIIDAAQARQQGAKPVDYLELDKDSVDDVNCYYIELEVRTEQDIPNSAILGVITPDGKILSLAKKSK